MATTPNYGWVTPAPTDFVTDLPADFEIFADAVDASFAADEGDLLVGGTSNIFEPLAIGAAGTVLTSDGDTAAWVAAGAAPISYSLLNSGNITLPTGANSFTVSGLTSFDNYIIFFRNVSSSSSNDFFNFRINASSASNYNNFGYNYINSSSFSATNLDRIGNLNANAIGVFAKQAATNAWSGYITIQGGNSTGDKIYRASTGATGDGGRIFDVAGHWNNTALITSLQVLTSSGSNFASGGTMTIYGGN
jgi:hypothetical protein